MENNKFLQRVSANRPGKNTAQAFMYSVMALQAKVMTEYNLKADVLYIGQAEKRILDTVSKRLEHVMETNANNTQFLGMHVIVVEADEYLNVGVAING